MLTYLEAAALGRARRRRDRRLEDLERAVDRAMVRYDRAGDQHYDVISAFIKSIRGSDADAALHYLARMIEAGEDPRFIARRLVVHASEDIGLADPTALLAAVAAAQAVEFVGLPEARINLAQAAIHLCLAPKSNAVIMAITAASADVQAGLAGPVPPHLRDAHYPGAAASWATARATPTRTTTRPGVVRQQYAPDAIAGRAYYQPTRHGAEARATPSAPSASARSWAIQVTVPRPCLRPPPQPRSRPGQLRTPPAARPRPAGPIPPPDRMPPPRPTADDKVGQQDSRPPTTKERAPMTPGQLAALIAAGFFALLVCVACYVLLRIARLLTAATGLVTGYRERADTLMEQAQAVVDRTSEQLTRTDAITASMDEVTANMAELSGHVTAMTGLASGADRRRGRAR